jgi:SAM-dependent methyltransferase
MGADPYGENWFGEASQRALQRLAWSVETVSGLVVEVGCWTGRSTCALANSVWPTTVHAVDTWQGSPGEISAELAAERDVFEQFRRNVVSFTRGNVQPHRMGWREWFAGNTDPIRFLHIDAEHTYDEVRENIEAALPFMSERGVICGDDAHHPPVIQAVTDVLGPTERSATLWVWRRTT